jgi:hypothetical protein
MAMNTEAKAKLVQAAQLIAQALQLDEAPAPAEKPAAATPPAQAPHEPSGRRKIAWGAKVSPTFRDRVWWICDELGLDPDWLMACMHWESGGSFSASVRNAAGSGAVGLIQFMPKTAVTLGTSVDKLAAMTAEDQLNFVYRYFLPHDGKLKSLADTYMAILWPAAIGKPDGYAIFSEGIAYKQNAGLDVNNDGSVTKAECAAKVMERLVQGQRTENTA